MALLFFPAQFASEKNWSSSSIIYLFLKSLTWLFQKTRQQGRKWGALHRESWYCWYGERERYLDIKSCVWSPFSGDCFQNNNDHLPDCEDDVPDWCPYFLPSEANGALVNDGRDVNGQGEPLFNRSNRVISLSSSSTRTVPTLAMLTTNFIKLTLSSRDQRLCMPHICPNLFWKIFEEHIFIVVKTRRRCLCYFQACCANFLPV